MEEIMRTTLKAFTSPSSSRLLRLLAISLSLCILLYFLTTLTLIFTNSDFKTFLLSPHNSHLSLSPPSLDHIVFGIASTATSWHKHNEYLNLWWHHPHKRTLLRGHIFLDTSLPKKTNDSSTLHPFIRVSEDTSRFRYTHKHGYRSAIRVARVVHETVKLNLDNDDVRWYVFGDGDTVFFPENLVKVLSKYDHRLWYYVGVNSEDYEQSRVNSFEMGFWEAGFALSAPLAKVLARNLDSCLERYHHVFGSDGRVFSCLVELGVGLTREPGFHQVDIRGNIFGLLAAHPLTPLVSLAHLAETHPMFPNMTQINALHHLFKAVSVDSERILQQTVCYDRWFSWTISISWGYAVQVFDHHVYLPDALRVQDTFSPWRKGGAATYTFSTTPLHQDPCRRPTVFFLDRVHEGRSSRITTTYRRMLPDNCTFDPMTSPKKLDEIVVFSPKLNLGINQLQAPRRQCCDVVPSSTGSKLELSIRECMEDELIRIHA